MWSDNESNIDLLRFSYLSSSVKDIILNPTLIPTTVGLFGDWGSGKSTIMKLIEKDLCKEDKFAGKSFSEKKKYYQKYGLLMLDEIIKENDWNKQAIEAEFFSEFDLKRAA